MKKSCLYFDKKYKCVSFIVHYKGLTLNEEIIIMNQYFGSSTDSL